MMDFFETPDFKVSLISNGDYLEKAQVLRQRVFFGRAGRDSDPFDAFCKHLVVINKQTSDVVGTYRLLLSSDAENGRGFYSETKFDLTNIKKHCSGQLLEMGRACVHETYRKHRVINLMWKAILAYMDEQKVSYILGCSGVAHPSPQTIGAIQCFFKKHLYAPENLRVYPLAGLAYQYDNNSLAMSDAAVMKMLPRLAQGYLKMGALVCGEPVWNKVFDTAVFFMLLDTRHINSSYKEKFA
jgi:putative hemolysin